MMTSHRRWKSGLSSVCLCLFLASASMSFADGDETLGPFVTSGGSAVLAAGTGLADSQPGTISLAVPAGVTINQVLIYWQGRVDPAIDPMGDDTVILETATVMATEVTGTLIGMSDGSLIPRPSETYRADITALGLLSAGTTNMVEVSGLNFSSRSDGATIVAIIDDGETSSFIDFRDGCDFAFSGFSGVAAVMVPQTFNFASEPVDRGGELLLVFGDGEADRPDVLDITVDGVMGSLCNQIQESDGPQWDTVILPVVIPAGATSLTIDVSSADCGGLPGSPDSITWSLGTLSIFPPEIVEGARVTGGGVDEFGELNGVLATSVYQGQHNRGDVYTFGGQAGAPTGAQPQPFGEWTHHQLSGPQGRFVFHAGTASASEGTEISLIETGDPESCEPARPAPVKQIRFEGVGEFQVIRGNGLDGAEARETLHYFCVRINDAGEGPDPVTGDGPRRGRQVHDTDLPEFCPAEGFDVFSDPGSLVDCDCPDFYEIKIFATPNPPGAGEQPIYHVYGYVTSGNLQIHPSLD